MADGSDEPQVVDAMVALARDGADVVSASRYMKGGHQVGGPPLKRLMSRTAGLTLHWFGGVATHDPTNNFKLYSRRFLDATTIESEAGFELALELTVKATPRPAPGRRGPHDLARPDRRPEQLQAPQVAAPLPALVLDCDAGAAGAAAEAPPRVGRLISSDVAPDDQPSTAGWRMATHKLVAQLRTSPSMRLAGVAAIGLAIALTVLQVAGLLVNPEALGRLVALDFSMYLDHTARALAGGSFYLDRQLHGHYPIVTGDSYYPPTTMLLFAPFLVLPALLWWVIPLSIIAAVVIYWRPSLWGLLVIAWCVWWWRSVQIVVLGNPSMWVAAAVAAGTVVRWPLALVILKPTLLPVAAMGYDRRTFWLALGVIALVSLPFGRQWVDYAHAALDSSVQWSYSLNDVPIVLIGLVAWLASKRRQPLSGRVSRYIDAAIPTGA